MTLVQSIKDNAQRLGLVWTLSYATVNNGDDPSNVQATFDGPQATNMSQTPLVSLIGRIGEAVRVAVMSVPPAGQYIIGTIGTATPGLIVEASSTTGTGAIGAETTVLTTVDKPYYAGRCYEARVLSHWVASVLNNQGLVRVRISGGGTVAVDMRTPLLPAAGSFVSTTICGQFQVATSRSLVFDETLTASAGTVQDVANATGIARRLQIWDIGPASGFSNLFSI